ncbi:MAG: T9SS type A sorting domain-containing protein [Bacteroidales bacterium]|nr:T9SS type A sorting domain-containing protein [Bacteroidales bacterium]
MNIFINIIYDVHPEYNDLYPDTTYWPPVTNPSQEGVNNTAIPTYLLDWMDTVYVPGHLHGTCTRLYGESSFDTLQITGDFMVLNLKESTVLGYGAFDFYYMSITTFNNIVHDMLEQSPALSLFTQKLFSDFRYKNYLIRNITKAYGGFNPGNGRNIEGNTVQCVGDVNISTNPTNIVTHEISHSFFGSNDFHTSGGNHRGEGCTMSFPNIQGGYGLMGAANSGLVCCNGYERWRMHWKHPQAIDYIAARNPDNTQSVVSDITREDGNKTFLLRDFVTYGDAVRIKLPYKDSVTSFNQYIWLENHQVGSNDKLDFMQYSNEYGCRLQGAAGIYAYYQIGRDVLSDTSTQVWDKYNRDNLKVIPAEGFFDYELVPDNYYMQCVAYNPVEQAVVRGNANPLCGGHDQEKMLFPEEDDAVLYVTREVQPWRIIKNEQNYDDLPFLGDNHDAFSTHAKINMGTNPSTNNAKTFHSRNHLNDIIYAHFVERNVQTTYLTGLGIEMTPLSGTGNILVSIRWDDYDINNDCRWTGKISLKDTAVLKTGNTITLAQNHTVAQTTRDPETGLFAGRTRWTCEAGSLLRQDSASAIVLTDGSTLLFEGGSRFVQADSAWLVVKAGCTLRLENNAAIVLRGTLEVDSGGVAYMIDTVGFGHSARIIVRPGGKLIVDGGTLTSACTGEMWQGIFVEGHRSMHQTEADQGKVVLKNGAVIENALRGIRTGAPGDNWHTTGGIITAQNSTFRNCAKAVEFLAYIDTSANGTVNNNLSNFKNCTFTVDANNLFSANNTSFLDHVSLWKVKGVSFLGCTFNNLTSNTNGRRHAIFAEDAGFLVDELCDGYDPLQNPPVLPGYCGCPANLADSCVFSGFATAIEANTAGTPLAVTVNRAQFANNGAAVRINANNFATVTECDFNLTACDEAYINQVYGLYLNNCTGYKVEGNAFYREAYPNVFLEPDNRTGIFVKDSGLPVNNIYRNNFAKLTKGVDVSGSNNGLQIGCCDFSQNSYDIYIPSTASVASPQGSLAAGADNSFDRTRVSNIYNGAKQTVSYYYSAGGGHTPYTTTGVTLYNNAAANACASTICGGEVPEPPVHLVSFISQMSTYASTIPPTTSAEPPTATDGIASSESPTNTAGSAIQPPHYGSAVSNMYYTAVRTLMADSLLDMVALEQWHAAAQPIADPYSLTETRFAIGYDADFAYNTPTIPPTASAEPPTTTDELYATFHNLKRVLRDADGQINWYALTPAQIAELQNIADAGTGRSSVMARGVLCFFFGICLDEEEQPVANLRRANARDGEGYLPVLTDDSLTFVLANRITYDKTNHDPYYLGAASFGGHIKAELEKDHDPYYLGAMSLPYTAGPLDTAVYNGIEYRKFGSWENMYVREDTTTGRIIRYYPEFDAEVVTCDMSLMPGDTFYFPDVMDYVTQTGTNIWFYIYYELEQHFVIVDSVTYLDGRKVIWFPPITDGSFFDDFFHFPLCFIEGVGPTFGPFGYMRESTEHWLSMLLCVHHNDSLIYMTDPVLGCEQHVVSVYEYADVEMKLYPTPAGDVLNVEFEGFGDPQGTLTVTNIMGVLELSLECHSPLTRLDVSHLAPGLYVVSFRNGKGVVMRKFVKM